MDRLAKWLACHMAENWGGGAEYLAVYEYYALSRLQRVLAYRSMLMLPLPAAFLRAKSYDSFIRGRNT